jgi:uncharacterized coiled-coil protein SlyX
MSSVLFNRGILTQTGARKKADDAIRDMDALKKSVTDAALTTAEHTTTIKTLQAQILALEGKLQALSEKTAPEDVEEVPEVKTTEVLSAESKSSKKRLEK